MPLAAYCLKTLEGGTILFEWSVLAWIACLPAVDVSGSASPVSGTPGQDSLQEGTKRVRFHPPFIQAATMGLSVAMTAI